MPDTSVRLEITYANAGEAGSGEGGSGGGNDGSGQPQPNPQPDPTPVTPTYRIEIGDTENGKIESDRTYSRSGRTIKLTVTPDDGYVLSELSITDRNGKAIEYEYKDGTYQFRMPSRRVNVEAKFMESDIYHSIYCDRGPDCPIWKYKDGDAYAWYHDGVHHLTAIGAVAGYSNGNYGPLDNATRSHVLVILWRLQGSPVVNYLMTYPDVAQDAWYAEAVRWATSEGIVSGYDNGNFGPDDELTRQQLAKILYNYNIAVGNVTEDAVVTDHIYTYEDIGTESAWAEKALRWVMNSHLMVGDPGMGGKLYLDPHGKVSRGVLAQLISRMTYMEF